jgi:hypothetical protein
MVFEPILMCASAPLLFATSRNLLNKQVSDVVRECAPTTEEQLRQRITDPTKWEQAKTKELPLNVSPMFNRQAGNCNTYLPSAGNMERLLFVVQSFIAQGMYVVLDYQPMGTEDHAYDLNRFVTQWAQVWKQVTCLPNWGVDIAGRVFVDVMNEPDSMGIRWEANNDHPGAQQLYLATADALWQQTPNQVMFMFEGACKAIGQLATVTILCSLHHPLIYSDKCSTWHGKAVQPAGQPGAHGGKPCRFAESYMMLLSMGVCVWLCMDAT